MLSHQEPKSNIANNNVTYHLAAIALRINWAVRINANFPPAYHGNTLVTGGTHHDRPALAAF